MLVKDWMVRYFIIIICIIDNIHVTELKFIQILSLYFVGFYRQL